jgi:hypothetical protein
MSFDALTDREPNLATPHLTCISHQPYSKKPSFVA